jgi:hypothetical protein
MAGALSRVRALVLGVLVLLGPPASRADWLNLTGAETAPNIAEISVLDDHVRVVLEVYVGDLAVFRDLLPDDWIAAEVERPAEPERLAHFAHQVLAIVPEGGAPLPVEIERIERRLRKDRRSPFAGMINPSTRRRVPEPPADKRVLYAELRYPFEGRPGALTIAPPLDEEGRGRVGLGFIAYHSVVPVIDFRFLGAPATLRLDWEDPWYSRFDQPTLKRHHQSALMSFLYVEPYEVRHEVLTRVRDLEAWMDLGLRGERHIEADEREALRERIGAFFLARNPVRVDGEAATPILDRVEYVEASVTGIRVVEQQGRLDVSTAMVGVILTHLTTGLPQKVTVEWELFSDRIRKVPATMTDPAGPLPTFLTPDDALLRWQNFLKTYVTPEVRRVAVDDRLASLRIPVVSVGTAVLALGLAVTAWRRRRAGKGALLTGGAAVGLLAIGAALVPAANVSVARPVTLMPAITDEEATAVLGDLLRNVYRAFDFRDEAVVYDKLALTVSGGLLEEVYLESRRSLAVQRAGGAQARVREVEVREASARRGEGGGYAIDTVWTAAGTVGHWGHTHVRENLYRATVTIEPVEGHWRITGLEILDEQRIDPGAGTAPS